VSVARRRGSVFGRSGLGSFGRNLAAFRQTLLADAFHQPHIGVAIDLHLPEGPCGEPVVVVAINNDRRVAGDPRIRHQRFKRPGDPDHVYFRQSLVVDTG